ncbi:MAG: ABC transporter substrate-binding protein [Opitutales bacterium]|nr:ABC transporter substrate-binding protein [Opitutales bacterium]
MKKTFLLGLALSALIGLFGCGKNSAKVVNVGMFPNVTHAQGVIAYQLSKEGRGWFEKYLPEGYKIEWISFNAGPSAINSIFGGDLDMTYVGPNPAINGYIKSGGKSVRLLAGSADGGAGLLVNPNLGIKTPQDFKGKIIGTPQLANTQDVACRAWLIANGLKINEGAGGDVEILPTKNPQQLPVFKRGDMDAAWTVEPWVSRLEAEAGAKMFLFEKDAVTTVFVARTAFLKEKPEIAKALLQAHKDLTKWINENPEEAQKLARKGIKSITGTDIPPELIASAWKRITFTPELNRAGIEKFVADSISCGFIKKDKIIGLNPLFFKFE